MRFERETNVDGGAEPLRIVTPWLARSTDGTVLERWETGDLVEVIDDSRFVLRGWIGRLVKVNGRRFDLHQIEERLRAELACSDVACLLARDALRGETFDVLVVAGADSDVERSVQGVLSGLGLSARRVEQVATIRRSANGKTLISQNSEGSPR